MLSLRTELKLHLLPLNLFPNDITRCLEIMPSKQRRDVNRGKNIATSSLPDPAITDQPTSTAVPDENQENPTGPATEHPITRADLDRVVAEVTASHPNKKL